MIERVVRRLKAERVWQHRFATCYEARRAVRRWIDWDNTERPR